VLGLGFGLWLTFVRAKAATAFSTS